jgi:hypothetical protein
MPSHYCCRFLFAILISIVLCGCSKSATVPVSAKFAYQDGSPVFGKSAMVILHPASAGISGESSPKLSGGELNEKGEVSFQISRSEPGLIPGEYRVCPKVAEDFPPTKWLVDAKYLEPSSTPLKLKVERGGKNHFEFQVDKSARK